MTILQSLVGFYDRLDRRGVVAKSGFAPVAISFVIPITYAGTTGKAIDVRDPSGKKPLPVDRMVPKLRDHNNSAKDPFLFWDNTGYAMGLVKKEMKRGSPIELFEMFKTANLAATENATSPELKAFRQFLKTWHPDQVGVLAIDPNDLDTNVLFRSVETGNLIHDVDEARSILAERLQPDRVAELCLVTGSMLPTQRLHPKFPSLEAGGNKAPLVSFNSDAFVSFGKDQGANAPVSEDAAFRYGAALNWLLDRDNSRVLRIGETTVVFWADEKAVGEPAAEAVEDAFWAGFGDPPEADIDKEQAGTMSAELQNVRTQRRAPDASVLKPETRMHILGLSPNSGRIAVRLWLVDTFGALAINLHRHLDDLAIDPPAFKSPPKAWALLYETCRHVYNEKKSTWQKSKNSEPPPRLGGEMALAILSGGRYPHSLLTVVVQRIRAEKGRVNGPRAALCKAVVNRHLRMSEVQTALEGLPVALNVESPDEAYNLGRLFAVYEYAEQGVAKRNASIRDKYIGAASANPRRIFPILMRGYEHNASALAKGEGTQRGTGVKAAKAVSQIIGLFDGDVKLPTALRLEDQARFFVGYYHQNKALFTKTERAESNPDIVDAEGATS